MMHSSSGSALLLVLMLSALMFLVASTLLLITMTEVHISDFEQRSTQAFFVAESGVALGISRLREEPQYRTATSDTMPIGGNTGLLNVQFIPHAPSLYRLSLRGSGSVPGLNAIAKRVVEREITIKPFLLFAQNSVTLIGTGNMIGNIHGNVAVLIDNKFSTVDGEDGGTADVTSAGTITNQGTVSGITSFQEPPIPLPVLQLNQYYPNYPTYQYEGKTYNVQPLVYDPQHPLEPSGEEEPPFSTIELYSGFPTSDNPAGVFALTEELSADTPTAIQVTGTLIIPSGEPLTMQGIIHIEPKKNFPALISLKHLNLTLIGNLEKFSKSLEKNRIEGFMYVLGNVLITANDAPGELLYGSLFADDIRIVANPLVKMTYDPKIFSNPPPGIDFIDFGAWREVF